MKPTKILLSSFAFHPSIGGLETSSLLLASGLAERGHRVTVITATPGETSGYQYKVVRSPDVLTLLRLMREADVVWQNHISLRYLWPLLFVRRPLIFMHHMSLRRLGDVKPHFGALKLLFCRLGTNVFVSKELRDDAGLPGYIVPNTYNHNIFRHIPEILRDRDVAFLGRLRRYKGPDLLINAVASLAAEGIKTTATIIGLGREEAALKAQAASAGISDLVDFTGPRRGEELARILHRHRILVVPSRCEEAFGIVALEAMACGCVVVGADSGGLPDVVGPCGRIFPKNDLGTLRTILKELLSDSTKIEAFRQRIPAQLAKFDKSQMLDKCEAIIEEAIRSSSAGIVPLAQH